MLVSTMNNHEVSNEIISDWQSIYDSGYFDRVGKAYDKLRRKTNVKPESLFFRPYELISKRKNKWIFFFGKAPSINKYKGPESISYASIVYYYTNVGLRVFKTIPTGGLSVYNGHLFKRYNERMNLGLVDPIQMVKHFFINNGFFQSQIIPKDNREYSITMCKDGILLGEVESNHLWILNKTFINRDNIRPDQEDVERDLIESLQSQIEEELKNGDMDNYQYSADVMKGIKRK